MSPVPSRWPSPRRSGPAMRIFAMPGGRCGWIRCILGRGDARRWKPWAASTRAGLSTRTMSSIIGCAEPVRWRQLAPCVLVIGLLASIALLPFRPALGAVIPALYGVATCLATVTSGFRRGLRYLPVLPVAFATIHLSWGFGFLAGLTRWGIPRLTPSVVVRA